MEPVQGKVPGGVCRWWNAVSVRVKCEGMQRGCHVQGRGGVGEGQRQRETENRETKRQRWRD